MKLRDIALSAIAIAMLASCGTSQKTDETVERKDEKPVVKLAQVFQRPVEQIQEYTATVEAEVKNNIAPANPVRISKILVEVGDRVAKGQRLVEMDDNSITQLKLQLENQELNFNRTDELYKIGGVSKAEWEQLKTALDVQKRAYQNVIENTSLASPISGVVTARNYDNGDMYSGGTPVITVEQITPVKLMINVSESFFTKIKKGAEVNIKLDVYGDEEFTGKINLVYPTIDPATRTFQVEVKLDNRDLRVRPGMFARVTVNFGTENRVVVPDVAVIKQAGSGDRYVYVYNNGKVSYKQVQLGQRLNTEYELISGVNDNSQVVIAGQARLLDGIEVEVQK
ncbi:efflux RND transporter periplasmic adaptor subunit [Bacteroides sp. OttesenSCG-928-E20]|nr:efflux RND transporter periplasmic adaptor subunit [Bacteroides sp. OttesenSCG-928-E20]MDL2305868.1 efflux RND transporter periplasmic adaptor subunit [Bacteroides sp. OttesenSCG-928-D19]